MLDKEKHFLNLMIKRPFFGVVRGDQGNDVVFHHMVRKFDLACFKLCAKSFCPSDAMNRFSLSNSVTFCSCVIGRRSAVTEPMISASPKPERAYYRIVLHLEKQNQCYDHKLQFIK